MGLRQVCSACRRRMVSAVSSASNQRCGLRVANYVGICYTFSLLTALVLLNAYVTCPKLYGYEACRGPILFGCWVAFNTFLNWGFFLYYARFNNVLVHARGVTSCVAYADSPGTGGHPQGYSSAAATSLKDFNNFTSGGGGPIVANGIPPPQPTNSGVQPWPMETKVNLHSRGVGVGGHSWDNLTGGDDSGGVDLSTAVNIEDTTMGRRVEPNAELLDKSLAAQTKYCSRCEMRVPNRCHHCSICNHCILLKDHHCFIVGACVGFGNHRYFITFLFWACIGASYGTLYTGRLLASYFPPLWPWGWTDYIMPVALVKSVFYHTYPHWVAYVSFMFSAGFAGSYGAFGFFIAQIFFVLNGTTMWDYSNRHRYPNNLSYNQRFRAVFGPWWLVNFLVPTGFPNRLDPQTSALVHNCYLKQL